MSRVRSSLMETIKRVVKRRYTFIATFAAVGILIHLFLRFGMNAEVRAQDWPLWLVLLIGGDSAYGGAADQIAASGIWL